MLITSHLHAAVPVQASAKSEAKSTDVKQSKSPRGSNKRVSFIKKLSSRLAKSKKVSYFLVVVDVRFL